LLQRISLTKSGKRKRAEELVIANVEKEKRAVNHCYQRVDYQNQRKKKRAEELVITN
jgi:hypothetical protein